MRLPARIGAAASFIAIAFAAACGSDSTGPSQSEQPSRVAQHFDSLAVQANTLAGDHPAFVLRTELLTLLEVNAAFGATPSAITVHTASGTEHWKGYEFLELSSSGNDSTYLFLGYRDADAHTVAVVYFTGAGAVDQAALVTGDTIAVTPSDGSGSTSITQKGAACGTISSALLNPQIGDVSLATCNLATFSTNLSLTLPSTTGLDAALTSVSFTQSTVNGIFVIDAASSRRVKYLLHSIHDLHKL
jgi:hypothetical protein